MIFYLEHSLYRLDYDRLNSHYTDALIESMECESRDKQVIRWYCDIVRRIILSRADCFEPPFMPRDIVRVGRNYAVAVSMDRACGECYRVIQRGTWHKIAHVRYELGGKWSITLGDRLRYPAEAFEKVPVSKNSNVIPLTTRSVNFVRR